MPYGPEPRTPTLTPHSSLPRPYLSYLIAARRKSFLVPVSLSSSSLFNNKCKPAARGDGAAAGGGGGGRGGAAAGDCPKKVARLVDLVNLPTSLRELAGGHSQMSHLSFFLRVWSHIKNNNLQDPSNRNIVNCDDKLKTVLLGRSKVDLSELPMLVKLHFPKFRKS